MTQKTNDKIPDLSNATPGFLIDEIGKLREEQKRIKFLEGFYKQALEARASKAQLNGTEFIQGEKYIGDRSFQAQKRINSELVVEELKNEPERLARCYGDVEFWQLNIKQLVTEV